MSNVKCPKCGKEAYMKHPVTALGTLVGGGGALTGSKLGELVDKNVIAEYHCPACEYDFKH